MNGLPIILGTETLLFPQSRVRRVSYPDSLPNVPPTVPAVYLGEAEEVQIRQSAADTLQEVLGEDRAATAAGFLIRHELWHHAATHGWPKDKPLPTKGHYAALHALEDIRNNRALARMDRGILPGMTDAQAVLSPVTPLAHDRPPFLDFLDFLNEAATATKVTSTDFPTTLRQLSAKYPTAPIWKHSLPKIAEMADLIPDLYDKEETQEKGREATSIQLDIIKGIEHLLPKPQAPAKDKGNDPAKAPAQPQPGQGSPGPITHKSNKPGTGTPTDQDIPEDLPETDQDGQPSEEKPTGVEPGQEATKPEDTPQDDKTQEAKDPKPKPQEQATQEAKDQAQKEQEAKDQKAMEDLSQPPQDKENEQPGQAQPPKPPGQPPEKTKGSMPQGVQKPKTPPATPPGEAKETEVDAKEYRDPKTTDAGEAQGSQVKQQLTPIASREAEEIAQKLQPIVGYVTGLLATGLVTGAGDDLQHRSPKFRDQGSRLNVSRFVRSEINPVERNFYAQDLPGASLNKGGKKNHLKYLLIGGLSRCSVCCDIQKSRYITAIVYLAAQALGVKPLYCVSRNTRAYPILKGTPAEESVTHLPNLLNAVSADPAASQADDRKVFDYMADKSRQLRVKDPRVGILLFDDECSYDPECTNLIRHGSFPVPTLRLSFNNAKGMSGHRAGLLQSLAMPTLLIDGDNYANEAAILHLTLKHVADFLKNPQTYLQEHKKGMRHVNRESLVGVPNAYPTGFPRLLAKNVAPSTMVDVNKPNLASSHASGCTCGSCQLGFDV